MIKGMLSSLCIGCAGALLADKELLRAGYNLRGEVCREMVLRRKEIEPFITGMFDAYVEAMALEGCWGGKLHTLSTVCYHHIILDACCTCTSTTHIMSRGGN